MNYKINYRTWSMNAALGMECQKEDFEALDDASAERALAELQSTLKAEKNSGQIAGFYVDDLVELKPDGSERSIHAKKEVDAMMGAVTKMNVNAAITFLISGRDDLGMANDWKRLASIVLSSMKDVPVASCMRFRAGSSGRGFGRICRVEVGDYELERINDDCINILYQPEGDGAEEEETCEYRLLHNASSFEPLCFGRMEAGKTRRLLRVICLFVNKFVPFYGKCRGNQNQYCLAMDLH